MREPEHSENQKSELYYRQLEQKPRNRAKRSHKRSSLNTLTNDSDDPDGSSFQEIFRRRPHVKARYGDISDSTLYRWIKSGIFPAPERLGPNVVGWRESILREYDADPAGWAELYGGP